MIEFHLPNFQCQVSEKTLDCNGNIVISDKKTWRYRYAESKEKLEELLKKDLSIYVHKIEPCNFMEIWKKKVDPMMKDAAEAIADNKQPDFPALWADLKEHLITLFHGKCGYCEAPFASVSFGDVEHYRPKGRVDEDKKHTGYYWLAYEPTNYLPACQLCNQPAKRDHFPIAGKRAYAENDLLDNEDPLLINPYRDAFEDHLEFLTSTSPTVSQEVRPGGLKGKTPKGQYSISTLELYREFTCEQRLHEMETARNDVKVAYLRLASSNQDQRDWDEFARSLQKYLSEDRPFRTAAYYEVREYLIKLKWSKEDVKDVFVSLGFHM